MELKKALLCILIASTCWPLLMLIISYFTERDRLQRKKEYLWDRAGQNVDLVHIYIYSTPYLVVHYPSPSIEQSYLQLISLLICHISKHGFFLCLPSVLAAALTEDVL